MEIIQEYRFEAAHRLDHLPPAHKCYNLHGHSYRLRLSVRGTPDPRIGWVMDFAEIDERMQPLLDQLDHSYLNDLPGLEISTLENLVMWVWERLKESLPQLAKIEMWETPTSGCAYDGSD